MWPHEVCNEFMHLCALWRDVAETIRLSPANLDSRIIWNIVCRSPFLVHNLYLLQTLIFTQDSAQTAEYSERWWGPHAEQLDAVLREPL